MPRMALRVQSGKVDAQGLSLRHISSCIMIRRLPRRMASFMLCVTMSVVRWFSSTISSVRLDVYKRQLVGKAD